MKSKFIFKIVASFLLIAALLFFIMSVIYKDQFRVLVEENVESYGLIALFLLVFFLEVIPQYLSPHLVMLNAWIIGLPIVQITVYSVLAHILASVVGFFLGKEYGLELVKKIYSQKEISNMEHKMNLYGRWAVFLSAFLPIPYIPVIFGSMNLNWKNFTIYGIIPRAVSFILMGFGLSLFVG